jgi:hypothetical protein
VAAVIVWNMIWLRSTADQVAYVNDSTMHESMVRFANQALDSFHLPMTQWYPYLNLGSPQFLHYQGLGATIAGFLGLFFGPNNVFAWSLYLMIVLWPLVIYKSAKVFGMSSGGAVAATLLTPFMVSASLVSFEQKAYIWTGFGIWAQLCASWLLPLAWAWTWRAMAERRYVFRAVLLVGLTAALHFETGYTAFGAIVVFPFLVPSKLRTRLKNAAIILIGALVATSWVTIPLLVNARWAAINTAIGPTGLVRGYGARQDLSWLFSGQLFDAGRLPVITTALGLGAIAAVVRWRREPLARAFVALFVVFFLVSWGPTTWGAFVDFIPGHADIYFRRFQASVSLAGIYLAGYGIAWVGGLIALVLRSVAEREPPERPAAKRLNTLAGYATLVLAVVATLIAIPALYSVDRLNAHDIGSQRSAEAVQSQQIDPMLSFVRAADNGRVYAGMPSNWGSTFEVGYVPVYQYLASTDTDQVGFTLRTASLMEQPEYEFDQSNPADYALYGIRYLLLPTRMKPPVPATSLEISGKFHLWALPQNSYFSIVVPSGSINENKGSLFEQAPAVQDEGYLSNHVDMVVNWDADPVGVQQLPTTSLPAPAGQVLSSEVDLLHGKASGTFSLSRPANVMLSASFDPGWQATVDGHPVATQMLAPALVSVPVPAGVHTVSFTYQGFQWYLELFIFSLAGLWWARRVSVRARREAARVRASENATPPSSATKADAIEADAIEADAIEADVIEADVIEVQATEAGPGETS